MSGSAPRRTSDAPLNAAGGARSALSLAKRAAWFSVGRLARLPERPVIVLGNQKAGTTAIAALLARRAGLPATLDFRYLSPAWLRSVHDGTVDVRSFVGRYRLDFSRPVVKEPHLSLLHSELEAAFPGAQFVMIVRDPRDNIRSILNRLGLPGHLDRLGPDWDHGVNELWRLVVDGGWAGIGGPTYIQSLAARWSRIADVFLDRPGSFALVRYEDFLADKEGTVTDLAVRLGLPLRNSVADAVDTQYQPRGDRTVGWSEFFGPDNLARIEATCRVRLVALGYPPAQDVVVPSPAAPPALR